MRYGIPYKDVRVVRQEMSPGSETILFEFDESEEAKAEKHGGLLGPDGMPVKGSL
jgi:hypothetical protein